MVWLSFIFTTLGGCVHALCPSGKCAGSVVADRLNIPNQLRSFDHANKFHLPTKTKNIICAEIRSKEPCILMATTIGGWLPRREVYDDDIFADDEEHEHLETLSVKYLAALITKKLAGEEHRNKTCAESVAAKLAQGKFVDMTCALEGEHVLENLFCLATPTEVLGQLDAFAEEDIAAGSIVALQSLLIMGMQVGVKGGPNQLRRSVSHLSSNLDDVGEGRSFWEHFFCDSYDWKAATANACKLKLERDTTAGIEVMAALVRKRSSQGALDLLISLGVWGKHENLALLRSGFPTRFTVEEEEAAKQAVDASVDIDSLLGLRKDLRKLKVYTIDNDNASEIDDGLSMEVLTEEDGTLRKRIWIHIADADRWAPRDSEVIDVAKRRATSIYLPTGSFSMFPSSLAQGRMSLKDNCDSCALSLGVELFPDGSIDLSSLILTPSLIRVTYRLTYEEADEMLEEGVGYKEEWQLGALLNAARKRQAFRGRNGAVESWLPVQIPQGTVFVRKDSNAYDELSINLKIEGRSNTGAEKVSACAPQSSFVSTNIPPVSPSNLLVTEMMILAGEAMGKWGIACSKEKLYNEQGSKATLGLELPFRSQMKPDMRTRPQEAKHFKSLQRSSAGGGYCAAWYFRRFIPPAKVSQEALPHSGLGLDCYVQWTSPIRRYGDLQVHAAAKRHLRRKRLIELIRDNISVPPELMKTVFGGSVEHLKDFLSGERDDIDFVVEHGDQTRPIDYKEGLGMIRAARPLQKTSVQYWIFEYINRMREEASGELVFECVVLGCVDQDRYQYAIFVHELGLEHRYLSERGELMPGETIWLKVANSDPRMGLLTLSLATKSSGVASAHLSSAPGH